MASDARQGRVVAAVTVALATGAGAAVADWTFKPQLELAESYVDNILLAPPGQEQAEWVTQVTPGLHLEGKGPRSTLSADYQMRNLFYAEEHDFNDTFHDASALFHGELLPDWVFFDLRGALDQTIISSSRPSAVDELGVTDNRTDVVSFSAGPYLEHRFGNSAGMRLQYQVDQRDYAEDGLPDNGAQRLAATLDSGSLSRVNRWQLDLDTRELSADDRPDATLSRAGVVLEHRRSERTALTAGVGYEENDYGGALGTRDGGFWSLGARWSPGPRTTLDLSGGRRFYGHTGALDLTHQTRQAQWQVSYAEEFVNDAEAAVQRLTEDWRADGQFPIEPGATAEVYLQRRLLGTVNWKRGRSTLSATATGERRTFQSSERDERLYGLVARWEVRTGARTRARLGGGWQRRRFDGSDAEERLALVSVSLHRQVSERTNATLQLTHVDEDFADGVEGYRQNIVTLALGTGF